LAESSYLTNDYHINSHVVVHDSSTPTQLFGDFKLLEYFLFNHTVDPKEPDYDALRPNFLYKSDEIIKKTFERSTQMARIPMSQHLRTWYRAPNSSLK
jgi:hypothetical protein